MTHPAFFTVNGTYQSFADGDSLAELTATVTFTPAVRQGGMVTGFDAAGAAIGFIPTPVVAVIDTDGLLKLRTEPDLPLRIVDTFEDLPDPGLTTRTYQVEATGLHYLWDAGEEEYVSALGYIPVRLLANDYLLGLDGDLYYSVQFTNVTLNGVRGKLSGFTFAAPSYDIETSLIELSTSDGNAMSTRWTRTSSGELVRLFAVKPGQHTDYTIGWDNRLAGSDMVSETSFELLSPPEDSDVLELFSPTNSDYNTQVWVRGAPTVGDQYEAVCSITTTMGRTLRQAFTLEVVDPTAESSPEASDHDYVTPSADRYWRLPANPGEDVLL